VRLVENDTPVPFVLLILELAGLLLDI